MAVYPWYGSDYVAPYARPRLVGRTPGLATVSGLYRHHCANTPMTIQLFKRYMKIDAPRIYKTIALSNNQIIISYSLQLKIKIFTIVFIILSLVARYANAAIVALGQGLATRSQQVINTPDYPLAIFSRLRISLVTPKLSSTEIHRIVAYKGFNSRFTR